MSAATSETSDPSVFFQEDPQIILDAVGLFVSFLNICNVPAPDNQFNPSLV